MSDDAKDLNDPRINGLLTRLDELVRWRPGAKGVYQDLHSAINRLKGSTNHIILGRRGSGKSRLLDELKRAVVAERAIVIAVGAEDFKELTYPDILIQILRSFLREFQDILSSYPSIFSGLWLRAVVASIRHPLKALEGRSNRDRGLNHVNGLLGQLDALLAESDEIDAEYAESTSPTSRNSIRAEIGSKAARSDAKVTATEETEGKDGAERKRKQREIKRIKVERLLVDFKRLLSDVCTHLDRRVVLAVDDFYFIRRADQPKVVDYVHRICKETNAFLKIATIKHRSDLFIHEDVSRGVVLGHEIQPINLELPLGQYD